MSSLQCMSVISCIVQLGYKKPANEGSKYFELGHEFLGRRRRPYIVFSIRLLYGFMFVTRIYIYNYCM